MVPFCRCCAFFVVHRGPLRLFMHKDTKGQQWNGLMSTRIWNYTVVLLTFLDFFFLSDIFLGKNIKHTL